MAEYPNILADNLVEDYSAVSIKSGLDAALTEDTIYRLSHLTDRSRLSCWKGVSGTAEQRVIWDMGSGTTIECDTFILDKNFTLTGSVTVYLDYSADGTNWTNCTSQASPSASTIYWKTFTAAARRYWRLRITGLTAQPVIYNVWLGKRLALGMGPQGEFDPYEEELVGDSIHGAAGGFQRIHRFRRRVLRAGFQNINDTNFAALTSWWSQAGRDGKNWWWLTYPTSEATDALYLNCEGATRRFGFSNTARSGYIEAYEVK